MNPLEQLAQRFEVYASDQIANRRWYVSDRDRAECAVRAQVWRQAASDLRELASDTREVKA